MTYKPFQNLLANTFIDSNGEVCNNLDNSPDPLAQKLREHKQRNEYKKRRIQFLAETKEDRWKITECRKLMEIHRSKGATLSGDERIMKFEHAAALEKLAKFLQEEVNRVARKYRVK